MGQNFRKICAICGKRGVETFESYEDGEVDDIYCPSCNDRLIDHTQKREEWHYYHSNKSYSTMSRQSSFIPASRTLTRQQAELECEEVAHIVCATCAGIAEEDTIYCLSCKLYWSDVRNGLFDD